MVDESFQPETCLAPTLAVLGDRPRAGLERLARLGFRGVQLSATQAGLRPRDLDRSGRRDLLGLLRRLGLSVSGLDLWIPATHLLEAARVDHAMTTLASALELAGDLGRCPVSLVLPDGEAAGPVLEAVVERALRHGVPLADHAVPPCPRNDVGVGVDPAAWLRATRDPAGGVADHVARLVSARLTDLDDAGERRPLGGDGGGRLDTAAYRGALEQHGYNGPVVVDGRGWPDAWGGLVPTAAAWADAARRGPLRVKRVAGRRGDRARGR